MEVLKADVFQHLDALELQTLVAVVEAVVVREFLDQFSQ
jgi:hypothetical protein